MPDLLDPADPRGGSGSIEPLVADLEALVHANEALAAPPGGGQTATSGIRDEARPRRPAAILTFDQVSKWYGPVIGVNQVTLDLRPGITGLVGANGSGKSTLMRLAAGHLRPDLGKVQVCGHDAWTAAAKRHVGYCPDIDVFYEEMSGRRFIESMARLGGLSAREARGRTDITLEHLGMIDYAQRRIAGYSKGMRQRLKLAQALIHDPELLLLDEPLSGIDPIGRRESISLFLDLARSGKCLLISSHELEELEKLTDHVAIMAHGRIAAVGTLTQIRNLLDNHPLSIRISCDQDRKLASALLDMAEVVGVDLETSRGIIVRARQPRRFFQKLTDLVLDEGYQLDHLETLDDSTHAILCYLLGAGR
jgi:ABC-2 type transport system ATP-binding protein